MPDAGAEFRNFPDGAAPLFLSFGKLAAAGYPLSNGSPGRPYGERELTNMDSLSEWTLTLKDRVLATSESRGRIF